MKILRLYLLLQLPQRPASNITALRAANVPLPTTEQAGPFQDCETPASSPPTKKRKRAENRAYRASVPKASQAGPGKFIAPRNAPIPGIVKEIEYSCACPQRWTDDWKIMADDIVELSLENQILVLR